MKNRIRRDCTKLPHIKNRNKDTQDARDKTPKKELNHRDSAITAIPYPRAEKSQLSSLCVIRAVYLFFYSSSTPCPVAFFTLPILPIFVPSSLCEICAVYLFFYSSSTPCPVAFLILPIVVPFSVCVIRAVYLLS